jgi:hypothetical protein
VYPERCDACGFPSDNIHELNGRWVCWRCAMAQLPQERELELEREGVGPLSVSSSSSNGVLEPSSSSSNEVRLGELPEDATDDMRAVAADFAARLAEHRATDDRPLPYATGYCAERCGFDNKMRASRDIHALVRAGVIECVGQLEPRGKRYGTKLYAEPAAVHREWGAA